MKNHTINEDTSEGSDKLLFGFERNVLVLSTTSFLTDASNKMVFPLIALFLDNVLGVTPSLIGLVEGVVECAASLLKMFSGWLSDRLGQRKRLITTGYWASTVAKGSLLLANTWGYVLLVRTTDRVGKGLRAAPSKAMVADASQQDQIGRTFGFYKMMDVAGGMMGLLASGIIVYLAQGGRLLLERGTYRALVVVAVVPAVLGAVLVTTLIREKRRLPDQETRLSFLEWAPLGAEYRAFLFILAVFALGHFSDAFLALRAQDVGASALEVVLLLIVFQAVYSVVAWPAGILSDRVGRKRFLVAGWTLSALVYVGFALASRTWQVWVLYASYGLYCGSTKGVERALVADLVTASDQRGAAYGAYSALLGLVALPASLIAGILWQAVSPGAAFLWGAALAVVAVLLLALWKG